MGRYNGEVPTFFTGTNSASPEYQKIFAGEPVSRNRIREENPNLVYALEKIIYKREHFGQLTLPEPLGDNDIIYPPLSADNQNNK